MRTPLFERHVAAGGRMVDFAGWEMPVQYRGIMEEHRTVRESCGVFDISHMGEFFVRGLDATEWLDALLTSNVSKLAIGEAHYSLMLNERGGVIDDLIVYRTEGDEFLLIVNAAKIAEDSAWMEAHPRPDSLLEIADYAALAVQGPLAAGVFSALLPGQSLPSERNRVIRWRGADGGLVFALTTGYTGEPGFELTVPAGEVGDWWDRTVAAGASPCGLGARDTLRLEMCYPLNGSDLSPDHTPLEAGLGCFVDLEKPAFIGREALLAQKAAGLTRRLAAIRVEEKSPPIRAHYPVLADGKCVGETSSGALSPTLGCGIAMAYLPIALAKLGQNLEIEVRGRRYRSVVVKKPFYQPAK